VQIGAVKGMRIFTTFGHPNLVGGFSVFMFPVLYTLIFSGAATVTRTVSVGVESVLVDGLVSNQTCQLGDLNGDGAYNFLDVPRA